MCPFLYATISFCWRMAHALSWLSEFYSLMDAFSSLVLTWKVCFKWDQNLVYGWLTQGRNFFRRTLSQSVKLLGSGLVFFLFFFFPLNFLGFLSHSGDVGVFVVVVLLCFFFSFTQNLIKFLSGDLGMNSFSTKCSVRDLWEKTGKIFISCKGGNIGVFG